MISLPAPDLTNPAAIGQPGVIHAAPAAEGSLGNVALFDIELAVSAAKFPVTNQSQSEARENAATAEVEAEREPPASIRKPDGNVPLAPTGKALPVEAGKFLPPGTNMMAAPAEYDLKRPPAQATTRASLADDRIPEPGPLAQPSSATRGQRVDPAETPLLSYPEDANSRTAVIEEPVALGLRKKPQTEIASPIFAPDPADRNANREEEVPLQTAGSQVASEGEGPRVLDEPPLSIPHLKETQLSEDSAPAKPAPQTLPETKQPDPSIEGLPAELPPRPARLPKVPEKTDIRRGKEALPDRQVAASPSAQGDPATVDGKHSPQAPSLVAPPVDKRTPAPTTAVEPLNGRLPAAGREPALTGRPSETVVADRPVAPEAAKLTLETLGQNALGTASASSTSSNALAAPGGAPVSQMTPVVASAPAPTPAELPPTASRQLETLIDNLVQARETGRTARGDILVRHAEFGAIAVRVDQADGDLTARMSSRDPGFAPAAQAALAERGQSSIAAASDSAPTQSRSSDASPQGQSVRDSFQASSGRDGQPRENPQQRADRADGRPRPHHNHQPATGRDTAERGLLA